MYGIRQVGEWYLIEKDSQPLLTPKGRPVETIHKSLADRLISDLTKYGESPCDPVSIVAFHYAMIDFFSVMPREELEHSVAIGLDPENDWTFNCPTAAPENIFKWINLFGRRSENVERGKRWLSSLSLPQLCAVCVLGRALESVNIPFIVATMLSSKNIRKYAKEICIFYPYISVDDLTICFENFLFYFSLG